MTHGQVFGPFMLVDALAGPTLVLSRSTDPELEPEVWAFVGEAAGCTVIVAIAGAVIALVMTRLLNSGNGPAARLRRYHSRRDR